MTATDARCYVEDGWMVVVYREGEKKIKVYFYRRARLWFHCRGADVPADVRERARAALGAPWIELS